MPLWFFATDLHGRLRRYEALLRLIREERPAAVLLGGDLLPHCYHPADIQLGGGDFAEDYLLRSFECLRSELGENCPSVFLILGNDDPRSNEPTFQYGSETGAWNYVHGRKSPFGGFDIYGYSCVPPTPFLLKDWERYDVSRYVDPGCVSPEEGRRTVKVDPGVVKWGTICQDLAELFKDDPLDRAVCVFHTPPYDTVLDRATLDGKKYDQVALDVHTGSIAVRRFIEQRQPLLTLHGHVHESTRLTGGWKTAIGRTVCINAAHDGPELALVRFDPAVPAAASRELI